MTMKTVFTMTHYSFEMSRV